MWKKMLILAVACVLIAAALCAGQDKIAEAKERIVQLRKQAHEAESRGDREQVKRFLNEAEEIERAVKREFEQRERPGNIDGLRREVAELKEAAARAEREGQHDKAAELHGRAKRLAAEVEGGRGGDRERKIVEAKKRIAQLRDMAHEAEARGEGEKAERFMAEAEEIERAIKREFEQRERPGNIDGLRRELAELKEAAAHAEREGQHDRAAELHQRAKRLAAEVEGGRGGDRERKIVEAKRRIGQLRDMAHEAKARGEGEKAERLMAEAEEIERALRRELEHGEKRPQIDNMRREIGELERAAEQARQRGQGEMAERFMAEAEEIERALRREVEDREKGPDIENIRRKIAELADAAERAERDGRREEAAELRERAQDLAMQIDRNAHRGESGKIEREIRELHAMAERAEAAGNRDKAEAIMREARELERHLRGSAEGREREAQEDLRREIRELREEVRALRRQVEELADILRNKARKL